MTEQQAAAVLDAALKSKVGESQKQGKAGQKAINTSRANAST
jgi:hypothetical protein